MYIQQLYTNCLAEAAYFIESNGEAAIIDPIRETEPYLSLAKERGVKIKYIFETHFHADFVSGHIDLSKATGAPIIYGPGASTKYDILNAEDNQEFILGDVTIKVLHTPGHTLESICLLLLDKDSNPHCVFTGDTLFVGDVGRPDLTGASSTLTSKDLAGYLFDSLQTKIAILPKETIVYPGHGAGSSCGKNIGKETFTNIGAQLESNYALRAKSKDEFIQLVLDGLSAPPSYFFADAGINKNGYKSILQIIDNDSRVLTSNEALERIKDGAIVIDTRTADEYELFSIKGSINIGLDGQFAIWAATLLPLDTSIVLVVTPGKTSEAVTRLARVGFDNVQGCIDTITSDFDIQSVQSISPEEFKQYADNGAEVIDVRNNTEQSSGIIKDAHLLPLATLEEGYHSLDKKATYLVHCAGGYRSMIACSLLRRKGFENVVNVKGGMSKIKFVEGVNLVIPELV